MAGIIAGRSLRKEFSYTKICESN